MPCQPFLPVRLSAINVTGQRGQAEGFVQCTIGEQTSVGRDPRTVELELQSSVEKRPQKPPIRLTLAQGSAFDPPSV